MYIYIYIYVNIYIKFWFRSARRLQNKSTRPRRLALALRMVPSRLPLIWAHLKFAPLPPRFLSDRFFRLSCSNNRMTFLPPLPGAGAGRGAGPVRSLRTKAARRTPRFRL